MKIFVSQPMNGRDEEEVLLEREVYANAFIKKQGILMNTSDVVIDNYHKPNAPANASRLWYLSDSLKQMSEADVVIFVPGWRKAKGCKVEMMCCKLYDIPYVIMKKI